MLSIEINREFTIFFLCDSLLSTRELKIFFERKRMTKIRILNLIIIVIIGIDWTETKASNKQANKQAHNMRTWLLLYNSVNKTLEAHCLTADYVVHICTPVLLACLLLLLFKIPEITCCYCHAC